MSELQTSFDYAFIGLGCANSLIILGLHRNGLLDAQKILIIEPEEKRQNDKTFCFWLSQHQVDFYDLAPLIEHSWSRLKINDLPSQTMENKRYYYLRAEHLYAHIRTILSAYNVERRHTFFNDDPDFEAQYVFDSRPPKVESSAAQHVHIKQSFFGQVIKTDKPIFDPDVFTMMDFSIPQHGQTQFLYVLPFATNKALIEPTRFGQQLISEEEATALIENFLADNNTTYQILEKEQGCIPMCSAIPSIHQQDPNLWIRTGANGGQLKPSTGYSFVRNLEDSELIVQGILNKSQMNRRVSAKRFQYYDRLLLHILARYPSNGKLIFSQLFERNKASKVLQFLDERSSIGGEVSIMKSLPILLFLKAAFLDLTLQFKEVLKQRSWLLLFCLLFVLLDALKVAFINHTILIIGLLAIGIPHGALDHLHQDPKALQWNPKFLFTYITLGLLMLIIWNWLPVFGLILFLSYTAWHFGQADFHHWRIKSSLGAFTWGIGLLALILFGHWQETTKILALMHVNLPDWHATFFQLSSWALLLLILGIGILGLILRFNRSILESVLVLLLSFQLPLISAFGLYFIFQHSWHGWTFLAHKHNLNFIQLWKKSTFFTAGAFLFFGLFIFYKGAQYFNWGSFFIFLSALSFPHVAYMHLLYMRRQ